MKNIVILSLLFTLALKLIAEYPVEREVAVSDGITPALTETRKRIAVIDSGIRRDMVSEDYMCKDMPIFASGRKGFDYQGHGTNIVGLIGERIDISKYCITSYSLSPGESVNEVIYFLYKMQKHGIVGLNISLASAGVNDTEGELLKTLTDKGVKVFIAAGNSGIDLGEWCEIYPACHKTKNKKLVVVGNKGNKSSNYGKWVDVWIDGNKKGYREMSGTSQATAIATGNYFSK
jgi:hypothetical protein